MEGTSTPRPKIDPKEWERMADAYTSLSVTVYLPKDIRDEMKYKDVILTQLQMQNKVREILSQHIDEAKDKIQQLAEAILHPARVEIELRGI